MKPIILTILDGYGLNKEQKGNAIAQAKTPNIDNITNNYPMISLQASGITVGLPWGEAGNSEVGHLSIGAGRIVYQSLPRIVLAIKDGSFFKNTALLQATEHVKKNNSCLHLMGLVSSGSVHSYIDHIYGLIELAKKEKVAKVRLHIFTDGEDSPPREASKFIQKVEKKLKELKDGKIATIIGRVYAMDRNKNWEQTQKTYECLVYGKGTEYNNPVKALEDYYEKGLTDTFIKPTVIIDQKTKQLIGTIQDNDSVIFFNFRKDRARQITKAFVISDFKEFSRQVPKDLCFVTMIEYEKDLPVKIAFLPIEIKNHLTEILSRANKKILKIAETEKYAHVSYFFNGGTEAIYPNEKRILIQSKTIPHYDQYPEMAASEITNRIINYSGKYDLTIANYANADMVAHTGNLQATIKAVEVLDKQFESLLKLVTEKNYYLLITADHGNAEEMINLKTGEQKPEHSANPVPFYLIGNEFKIKKSSHNTLEDKPQGIISDVAPTILKLMNVPQPSEMTGKSLLEILK